MNFIVVSVKKVEDPDAGVCEGIEPEELEVTDRVDVVLCKDFVDVAMALKKSEKKGAEWAVFEVLDKPTGKTTVRRAVVFEKDGQSIRSIE
jgi:hypothetical protein